MPKNTAYLFAIGFLLIACNTNIGQSSDLIKQKNATIKMGVDGKLETNPAIFNTHLTALRKYGLVHNCSSQYGFLVDMAVHSGTKRFFVVEMKTGKIVTSGLVTHGSSKWQMEDGERKYSNENSSLCTSLGKYKSAKNIMANLGWPTN